MFGLNCKRLLFGVVVVAALVSSASQADAFWGWGYHRACYSGCYTPCYSACYTPCYTACYTPCYTSCYTPCYTTCCYPSCGYGCYSSCCWSSSCYSHSCCDGTTAAAAPATEQTSEPTPAQEPGPEPADAPASTFEPGIETPTFLEDRFPATPPATPPAAVPDGTSLPLRETSGMLVVHVPYDALVTINGLKTSAKGSRRKFVSHGLKPGYSYKYEVRAQVIRDGRPVEEVHTVLLTAGDREAVAFGFNPELTQGLASR